jgi:ubiquinone/menaquinone biosynthesis C-methylase UbiE
VTTKPYIPALSFRLLTPLYDPILKWVMREDVFKRKLVSQARILPGMKVLDLGCGTGTLTVMLKEGYPNASITGLDGDPQVLEIAREKSGNLNILWDQAMAYALPYPDKSFDRVVTSLVIHHLVSEDKRSAFQEVFRVLKPNGELYVLDFGAPHSGIARLITRYMHGLEEAADNFDGLIPPFISEAGFESVGELDHFVTVFGPLSLWRAVKGS